MRHGHDGKESKVDIEAERFFPVDRAVLEHHSQPSGLPLILAALPEHHHLFHEVSGNPLLLLESSDIDPDALSSIDELCQRAWQLIEPRYLARLAALVEACANARFHRRNWAGGQAEAFSRVSLLIAPLQTDGHMKGRTDAHSNRDR